MSLGKQCFALKSGEVCSGKSIERRSAFSTCVSLRGGILVDSHLLGAPFSLRWTWGGNSRVLCVSGSAISFFSIILLVFHVSELSQSF